jgi:hypothetical protein
LWPEFTLGSVVGHKISGYRVARARPESIATAKIVSRLKPQQSIPSSEHAVLNYKLSVPGRVAFAIAIKTAAPSVGLTHGLVKSS